MNNENRHIPSPSAGAPGVWVGTSGYSYAEWTDAGFYPPGTRSADMLAAYARAFSITELNYTWYQMPRAPALERMVDHAPPGFLFAAKLHRSLTHETDPNAWRGEAEKYRQGVAPLARAGRLAAILAQFPPGFHRSPENRLYLARLLDELQDLPMAVEFRHASWAEERVFQELSRRQVALACVDVPPLPGLFPVLWEVTGPDFFYIRFHGKNARGWRSGNMQNQFDYDYPDAELSPWADQRIPAMLEKAGKGFVFFNNHVRAQAPKNARQLMELLPETARAARPPTTPRKPWNDPSSI